MLSIANRSQATISDSFIEREFMPAKRCCSMCRVETFYRFTTVLFVLFDFCFTAFKLFMFIVVAFLPYTDYYAKEFIGETTYQQRRIEDKRYLCVMSPLLCVLVLKTIRGI